MAQLKPGDTIEWVYKSSARPVSKNEKIWSSTMNCLVPVDEPSLLISITDETYTWLNSKGLFHAGVDDTTQRLRMELALRLFNTFDND